MGRREGRVNVGGEVVEPRFEALPRLEEVTEMEIDDESAPAIDGNGAVDQEVSLKEGQSDATIVEDEDMLDGSSDSDEVEFDSVVIPPAPHNHSNDDSTSYRSADNAANEPSYSINLGPPASRTLTAAETTESDAGYTEALRKIEREPDYDDSNPTNSRAGKIIDGDASDSESENEDTGGQDDNVSDEEEQDVDGQAILVGLENLFSRTCRALEDM